MILYASYTGTLRNLAALRQANAMGADCRMLVTPARLETNGFPFAYDNGAWSAHQQGRPFDADAFERGLDRVGARADWAVVPDIVAGGLESLAMSLDWVARLVGRCRLLLLALQDGMSEADIDQALAQHPDAPLGLFVGGSTDWKLGTLQAWGRFAAARGLYLHVGRVNTARRIALAAAAGADSFDGTSATRFAKTVPLLVGAKAQPDLLSPRRKVA